MLVTKGMQLLDFCLRLQISQKYTKPPNFIANLCDFACFLFLYVIVRLVFNDKNFHSAFAHHEYIYADFRQ